MTSDTSVDCLWQHRTIPAKVKITSLDAEAGELLLVSLIKERNMWTLISVTKTSAKQGGFMGFLTGGK
jgi:hypothetical protein